MRFIQSTLCLLLLTAAIVAEEPHMSDVPEPAHLEVLRRGTSVEPMGTIQAGPEAAVIQAVAPPEDDSDRWWFSVVGCSAGADDKAKASTKLLLDDVAKLKFKQWVKPEDLPNSWAHYQERRIDDPTQQDWLSPLKQRLEIVGLPAIVIQPPKNGEFGKNSNVVAIIGSYDGDADHVNYMIEERVKAYTVKHAKAGTIPAGSIQSQMKGYAQAGGTPIEAKPPFALPPPIAYPPVDVLTPPKPAPPEVPPLAGMTYAQIRKTFPEIPPTEARDYAAQGLTEDQILEIESKLNEVDKIPAPPTMPTQTTNLSLWDLLGLVVIGVLSLVAVRWIQLHAPAKPTKPPTN